AGRGAVKRAIRRQDFVPSGQRSRDLDRVFVRFAAAGGEEDAAAFAPRRDRRDRIGQRFTLVVAQARRDVADLGSLLGNCDGQSRMRVAEIDGDESRREVDVPLSVLVEEKRSFAADDLGYVPAGLRNPRREDARRAFRRQNHSLNHPEGSTARLTLICLTSVYASYPYVPSSRPMPDCL